jgi:hypothetical protein
MHFVRLKRRQFITLLGGAAAGWPLATRAQQPAVPTVGFLRVTSAVASRHLVAAFHQGLKQAGFIEGQNVGSNIAGETGRKTACRSWRRTWCGVA